MDMEQPFPALDAAPAGAVTIVDQAAQDLVKVDLQAVALAHFAPARAAIATAVEKLTGVVHDLSTPTKLADAKSLRHRLINTPLADARKTSVALKSRLTKVSKAVGDELESIEGEFAKAESLISPQIKKREDEIAEEARIAAEKEAARVQAHRDALAKLAAPAERAALPEMTAERIANGIAAVEAIVIDRAAWEEFADRAEEQKAVTLERMRKLHAQAVAAEAEAARLAAEKAEAERKAAELKAAEEKLAAERAELERERAAIQAEKDRLAAEAQYKADEAARIEREAAEAKAREEAEAQARADAETLAAERRAEAERQAQIAAQQRTLDAAEDAAIVAPPPAPAPEVRAFPAPAVAELPTMTLGQISTRLGFTVTADFLAALGFEAQKEKASRLYRPSVFPAICEAISAHVLLLGSDTKKAA